MAHNTFKVINITAVHLSIGIMKSFEATPKTHSNENVWHVNYKFTSK